MMLPLLIVGVGKDATISITPKTKIAQEQQGNLSDNLSKSTRIRAVKRSTFLDIGIKKNIGPYFKH